MKVLVTGANGYLGKGTVRQLLESGYEVVAASNCKGNIDERATIISGDIFRVKNPYEYYGQPDIVLHMAWRNGFIHNSQSHIEDLSKHALFLEKLAESGVSQIAAMGSVHEIGFYEGSVNENTPCNPLSMYGISKNALRRIVELKCKETGVIFQWLRGFYIVANSRDGSSVFSKIAQAESEHKKFFPFTFGQNQFDFLEYSMFCKYVKDVIGQTAINGVINICSGRPEKLADRVERFIRENQFHIKLSYGTFPDRPYDSKAVWGDDTKLREIEKKVIA